ncbi:hypothetical protein J7I44_05235 [Frateuria sp. MAH-13]|uniref:Tetratrico peptide repeat group 5 domain-containing protein n=1 Tax=Frateuria flava TaxID=2821489 RepID=A0ABS4DKW7_9GAMM|nr:hypothetical protein [Frateuria flava]MBP1473693.1 hypothetical protein [Frateuria flava]
MSSILRSRSDLSLALDSGDLQRIVSSLEEISARGDLSEEESISLGVALMLPPIDDGEAASMQLAKAMDGPRAFEAAVWDVYRYVYCYPDEIERAAATLRDHPKSAVACHMLSLLAIHEGDYEIAKELNSQSRQARTFPANAIVALENGWATDVDAEVAKLHALLVTTDAEQDPNPSTVAGWLEARWANLVLGTRLSSVYWQAVVENVLSAERSAR